MREIRLRDRINILHPLPQYHIKYVGYIFTGYEFYYLVFFFQWVTFVMMIQAGTFMLPKKIWTALEGGLMGEFFGDGGDAKNKVILTDEFEEAVFMEAQVDKYLKFFRSVWHRNNWYFSMFVLCEVLNCIVLFFNFWCCDVFLNGKFYYYGWDVIQYARMSKEDKEINVDPFCSTFPLEGQ